MRPVRLGGLFFVLFVWQVGCWDVGREPNQQHNQLTLLAPRRAPIVSDSTLSVDEDSQAAFQLSASDPESNVLEYQITTGPTHGQIRVDSILGLGAYSPDRDYFGADDFFFRVSDGTAYSAFAQVLIDVHSVNDQPIAFDVAVESLQFASYQGQLTGHDIDCDALGFVVSDEPESGQLELDAFGHFSFAPLPSQYGLAKFRYAVFDGASFSEPAEVRIDIKPLPFIEAVVPQIASANSVLVLTGERFGAISPDSKVVIGGNEASIAIWTDRYVAATIPADSASGDFSVRLMGRNGESQAVPLVISPTITEVLPADAAAAATATILGVGFDSAPGAIYVGGVAAEISAWSTVAITFTVPAVTKGEQPLLLKTAGGIFANIVKFTIHGSDLWIPDSALSARSGHAVIWTGKDFMIWGGFDGSRYLADGARYNASSKKWTRSTTTAAPSPRSNFVAVWLGEKLLIWGGENQTGPLGDGALYDPTSDSWEPLPTVNSPSARTGAKASLAGTEVLIWGGKNSSGLLASGGRYDWKQQVWRSWSTLQNPGARDDFSMNWTGSEAIIWGGVDSAGNFLNSGAIYDPASDRWRGLSSLAAPSGRRGFSAAWSGKELLVWGGFNGAYLQSGGRYNPVSDQWLSMSPLLAPSARAFHQAIWQVDRMWLAGGIGVAGLTNTGAIYFPETDSWQYRAIVSPYADFISADATWGASQSLIWGGLDADGLPLSRGFLVSPSGDVAGLLPASEGPERRFDHSAVWTGDEMIIWGGDAQSKELDSGARWSPATLSWKSINSNGAPSARSQHNGVWLGESMLVASGQVGEPQQLLYDAYLFFPNANTWFEMGPPYSPFPSSATVVFDSISEQLLRVGGQIGNEYIDGIMILPVENVWLQTSTSKFIASGFGMSVGFMNAGDIYFWGGYSQFGFSNVGDIFSVFTGSWRTEVDDLLIDFQNEQISWNTSDNWIRRDRGEGKFDLYCSTGSSNRVNFPLIFAIGKASQISLNYGLAIVCGQVRKFSLASIDLIGASNNLFQTSINKPIDTFINLIPKQFYGSNGYLSVLLESADGCGSAAIDNVLFSNVVTTPPAISIDGAPSGRAFAGSFSQLDGCFYVWGGEGASGKLGDGKRYCMDSRTWTPMSSVHAPSPRTHFAPVWTGSKWFVWGGEGEGGATLGDGAVYDPALNQWHKISSLNAPIGRSHHTAIWTGKEVVVFGGKDADGHPLSHLGRYIP